MGKSFELPNQKDFSELDGAVLTPESMKRALKNGYSDKAEIKRMFEGFTLDVISDGYED